MKDKRHVVMLGSKVVRSFETKESAECWVKISGNPYVKYTIKPYKR